jgi:hypothetical protein
MSTDTGKLDGVARVRATVRQRELKKGVRLQLRRTQEEGSSFHGRRPLTLRQRGSTNSSSGKVGADGEAVGVRDSGERMENEAAPAGGASQ